MLEDETGACLALHAVHWFVSDDYLWLCGRIVCTDGVKYVFERFLKSVHNDL